MVSFYICEIERTSAGSQFSDSASQVPEGVFQPTRVAGTRAKTDADGSAGTLHVMPRLDVTGKPPVTEATVCKSKFRLRQIQKLEVKERRVSR